MAQPWELVVIILIRKCQRPDCRNEQNNVLLRKFFYVRIVQMAIIKRKVGEKTVKIFNFLGKKHTCFVNVISDKVISSKNMKEERK